MCGLGGVINQGNSLLAKGCNMTKADQLDSLLGLWMLSVFMQDRKEKV
jgi:hypothetical protein